MSFDPITLSIIGGLTYLTYRKIKKATDVPVSEVPATRSTRGVKIPALYGKRMLGPIAQWYGTGGVIGGGGGKSFGAGGASQSIFFSRGRHVLCAGPADILHGIYTHDGKTVWEGPIDRDGTDSGDTINLGGLKKFRIYWGENDQPATSMTDMVNELGYAGIYPGSMAIEWDKLRNGHVQSWPDLRYLVTSKNESLTDGVLSSTQWITANGGGVNPAHIIYAMFTAPRPFGRGLPASYMDTVTLDQVGTELAAEGLAMNYLNSGAQDLHEVVEEIRVDCHMAINQSGDKVYFDLVREGNVTYSIPAQQIDLEEIEGSGELGQKKATRNQYLFKDADHFYEDSTVNFSEDSIANDQGGHSTESTEMRTVTNGDIAAEVASRRDMVESGRLRSASFTGKHWTGSVEPGVNLSIPSVGNLLVTNVKQDLNRNTAAIKGLVQNAQMVEVDAPHDPGIPINPAEPIPDLYYTFFQVPPELATISDPQIAVFRIRAKNFIEGANIHISESGVSYVQVGQQTQAAAGGLLTEALSGGTALTIEDGPAYEPANDDFTNVLDLTGETVAHENGTQLAVITDGTNFELFYLRNQDVIDESNWAAQAYSVGDYVKPLTSSTGYRYKITAAGTAVTEPTWPTTLGGTVTQDGVTYEAHHFSYRLKGLIRTLIGSRQIPHAIGDTVYIIEKANLELHSHSLIVDGVNLCVKSQPYFGAQAVDLSAITEVCRTINVPTVDTIVDHNNAPITDHLDLALQGSS